jgi:hypothetical protein
MAILVRHPSLAGRLSQRVVRTSVCSGTEVQGHLNAKRRSCATPTASGHARQRSWFDISDCRLWWKSKERLSVLLGQCAADADCLSHRLKRALALALFAKKDAQVGEVSG